MSPDPMLVTELVSRHPDFIVLLDDADRVLDVNDAVRARLGTVPGVTPALDDLFGEEAATAWRTEIRPRLDAKASWRGEQTWRTGSGQGSPVFLHAVRLSSLDAGRIALYARDLDDSARPAMAADDRRHLRALFDGTPVALLAVQMDGEITAANARAGLLLGVDARALAGASLLDCCAAPGTDRVGERLRQAYGEQGVQRWTMAMRRPDSMEADAVVSSRQSLWATVTVSAVTGPLGHRLLLVALEDSSEHNRLEAEISFQAEHDALTGLLNRRGLERVLAQREHELAGAYVFHLNVDYFRYINELVGQHVADDVLGIIATALRRQLPDQSEWVARVGADEFVLVHPGIDRDAAQHFAQSLIGALDEIALPQVAEQIALSGCIGMTRMTDAGPVEALAAASAACYQAKASARGSVREYTKRQIDAAAARKVMSAVQSVRRALAEQSIELFAQPIYLSAAPTGMPHCVEILARFRGRDTNAFPPDLLASAERFGLMDTFDRYVVVHTLEWMQARPDVMARADHVAINLSGNSVSDPSFCQFLRQTVEAASVAPSKLCFEITETAAVRDIGQARRLMEVVGELGCRFSLDDFGAGMCSFQYLRDLPADYVKIDGSFVQGMEADPVRRQIVRAINETAQILGKQTVAEFVDNPRVLTLLQQLGVNMVQGWLFNPAMPLGDVERLLQEAA